MDEELAEIGHVAPTRVDLLFEDRTEEEKLDIMLYLLKNTYTHEVHDDSETRQPFLWLVYDKIENFSDDSVLAPLFKAWNQILDILPDDKKNGINMSIDYNAEYDICMVHIIDWNGLSGREGSSYSEEITDDDVMRELMTIIMYKAYSVDRYGPGGRLKF